MSDAALRLAETQTATVTVEVLPAPVERDFANVPVRWRNLGAGLSARIQPSVTRVTIRGRLPALDAVRAETIDAFVDLAGLGPGPVQSSRPDRSNSELRRQLQPDPSVVQVTIK